MANELFLVVRVADVTGAPVDEATITARVGATSLPLARVAGARGTFEVRLPAATAAATLEVADHAPFWGLAQALTIGAPAAGRAATLSAAGAVVPSVTLIHVHSRGTDWNLGVDVTLGQLRDARPGPGRIDQVAVGSALVASPIPTQQIPRFPSTPLLDPAGAGPATLRRQSTDVSPPGRLFFAERHETPKLIALHLPWTTPPGPRVPWHVFFHPSIPGRPSAFVGTTYPFGASPAGGYPYLDLAQRYLLTSKRMVHQNTAAGARAGFILPVGRLGSDMDRLSSPSALLRLVLEVNFWAQRMSGVARPLPLGELATSCFSAGVRFMNACIFGRRNATLDQHLRHIYVLDGVFASRPPAPGIAETREFTTRLKRWHGPGKSFRVYTQSALWWEELRSFGSPSITNSHGAHEAESPTTTVLHVPREYWANNWPPFLPAARQARDDDIAANRRPLTLLEYVYWNVHQVIPTTFMEHAVANTTFA